MTESDSYNISDRLRSRSGRHGGTGDSNMGNTESKAEAPRSSSASNVAADDALTQPLYKYLVCASSGFVFGFAMEKGRVHEPAIIRDMMVMKNFTMLKMFLSAVSAGMLSMVILATYPRTRRRFLKVCDDFYSGMSCKSVTSSALGGLIIGIGMPISGSCPTSVFVQLGSFCPNACYTMLGGLVSTLAYGFLKPMFDSFTKPSIEESSNPWTDSPYYAMAMPITLMFAGLVSAFEMLVPWTTEVQVTGGNTEYGVLSMRAWPPWVAGIIIGAIQIPLILGVSQTLGGTSSLVTMVSQVFVGPLKSVSTPFLNLYKKGFSNWWQVFYVTGAMGGAFTSAYMSGSLGDMTGVTTTQAFSGGILLMLGARIAGGCTSGHGITGMGFMSILSLIATAAMFGGGMATGFSMKYLLGAY